MQIERRIYLYRYPKQKRIKKGGQCDAAIVDVTGERTGNGTVQSRLFINSHSSFLHLLQKDGDVESYIHDEKTAVLVYGQAHESKFRVNLSAKEKCWFVTVSELQEQLISFNVVLPGTMLPLRTRFRLPSSHPILQMLYLLVRTSMLLKNFFFLIIMATSNLE